MKATTAHRIAQVAWWVIAALLVAACSKAASGSAPKWMANLVVVWFLAGGSYSIARNSASPIATQFRWVFMTAAVLAFLSLGSNGISEDWSGEDVFVGEEAAEPWNPSHRLSRALSVLWQVAIGCSAGVGAARFVKSRK